MALLQNVLLVLSSMMLIVLAIRAGAKLKVPGVPALLAMMFFFIIWIVGDLIEANSPNFIWMLWGRNIQQIGVFFTPLCSLYFSIEYTLSKRMRIFTYVMTVVQSVSLFLIFTDQATHIMRSSIEIQKDATFGQTLAVHSTALGSILVSFNFCLPLISLIILSLFARTVSAKLRRSLWMVIISIFLTLFVAVLQTFFLSKIGISIPIPILNLPCVFMLFYAILNGKFLGLSPTALSKVFEVIDQGILVLDPDGVVTDFNGRASELINAVSDFNSLEIGTNVANLLLAGPLPTDRREFSPEELPAELSGLERNLYVSMTCHTLDRRGGKPIGYVLVLTDITSLKERAELDPMTGVYNREGISNAFKKLQNHPDADLTLSAMIIDIDRFKNINDTYGHFAGDAVLLDFVKAAKNLLPGTVILGRYGGDEFVAIFFAGVEKAFEDSEKLRMQIYERSLSYLQNEIQYTVSIGVASEKLQDVTLSTLLDKADQALYKAKQQGRNRTSI